MPRPSRPVEIGNQYGYLTVLSEAPKDKYGHRCFNVKCKCGTEFVVQKFFLFKTNPKCKKCADRIRDEHRPVSQHEGKTINGFTVIKKAYRRKNGTWLYECRCNKCGTIVFRNPPELKGRAGKGCENCYRPTIQDVKINGDYAEAVLPSGDTVLFDAKDVDFFKSFHWSVNSKGYVERTDKGLTKLFLYWKTLGYNSKPPMSIDHINRNKLDNRSCNLRFVTDKQNGMNHSKLRTNTSGYTGVFFNKRKQRWTSFIWHNGKHIYFGHFKDKILAAQCYNEACKLLRGGFAGELNDVPEADIKTKKLVYEKCRPYLAEALIDQIPIIDIKVTLPVAFFNTKKENEKLCMKK